MYEAWFRFKKKLSMVPHQKIPGLNLLEIFYISLNVSSREMADMISGGALMHLFWEMTQNISNKIFVTNQ